MQRFMILKLIQTLTPSTRPILAAIWSSHSVERGDFGGSLTSALTLGAGALPGSRPWQTDLSWCTRCPAQGGRFHDQSLQRPQGL